MKASVGADIELAVAGSDNCRLGQALAEAGMDFLSVEAAIAEAVFDDCTLELEELELEDNLGGVEEAAVEPAVDNETGLVEESGT